MNTTLILAQLALIQTASDAIRAECEPPPPPVPPTPTLAVATFYGWDALTFEFAAAAADGGAFSMQYRAHDLDVTGHGPQEWTDLQTSGVPNLSVPNSADRILEVRAWCEREGVRSEHAVLVLSLNDFRPVEETPAEG
jgi:hypothetical protein